MDLLITSQLLYQLSYAGSFLVFRAFRFGTMSSLAKFKIDASVFLKKVKKNYKINAFDDNSTDLITARAFICVSVHSDSGFES